MERKKESQILAQELKNDAVEARKQYLLYEKKYREFFNINNPPVIGIISCVTSATPICR